MAVLGVGGILELSREWAEPMALSIDAINYTSSPKTITLGNESYWTGDRVIIASSAGVPFDVNGDGYADCPDGHGIYRGSFWSTGPSRAYYTGPETGNSPFYEKFPAYLTTQNGSTLTAQDGSQFLIETGQDSGKYFYNRTASTGFNTQASGYIATDALGRIRLFSSEYAAHNLEPSSEIQIKNVKIGNFVIARYSANSTYTSALSSAANSIAPLSLPSDQQELASVITPPAGIEAISGSADERGWTFQAQLQEWALDIDASNLDMTAIGETFGENTKALVRGAGNLQFFVEHQLLLDQQDSVAVLRLVLLTQRGCKTSAKFYMYKNRDDQSSYIGGSIYYLCDLLLTNSRLNVRPDEAISGTSDFVVSGEISLHVDP